jgi:chromate reductase
MASPIHVLGFAGSLRKQSHNVAVLRAAGDLMPAGMSLELYDLASLPFYNQDEDGERMPDSVREFKRKIADADALLIATPEYNHSIPGVLKNALDWASRPSGTAPTNGKPAAILGASPGGFGAVRAQLHLRQILASMNVFVLPRPEVAIPFVGQKLDEEGHVTDEQTREFLRAHMIAFASWVRRLRGE